MKGRAQPGSGPDGVVAFFILTNGPWVLTQPDSSRYHGAVKRLLEGLLTAAVAFGVPASDCIELIRLLVTAPDNERAIALAVLIASEIPDEVVNALTDKYLPDSEFPARFTEPSAVDGQLLARLKAASGFASVPRLH
jgi:hypothetical protein